MSHRILVIYGAGEYGKRMHRLLQLVGAPLDYFCQTEVKDGDQVEGIPVISAQKLFECKERMLIFVAIGNSDVSRQIRMHLNSVFMERATVIECGSVLRMHTFEDVCPQGGYCVLCNSPVGAFLSGGVAGLENVRLFKEHHVIGGGVRKNYQCPVCGGVDRERWQLWVLSKHTGIFREKCRVLHFAPEPHLSEFIAANPDCDYYTGDIVPGRAMHQTDILDIQYKENTFDYVIMNHVLEHIPDMDKAMAEVKRVLKPDGKLVLSFPICADQDTLELPGVMTAAERLENYGQEDHVRLFGRDYLERIKAFGLDVKAYSPRECCTQEEVARYGFIENDVSMICTIAK